VQQPLEIRHRTFIEQLFENGFDVAHRAARLAE